MISIFRDKSIIAIFGLVICGLLIHLHIFYVPITIKSNSNSGVFSWLIQNYFSRLKPFALNIIYILILLLQAIRLNMILNNSKMFSKSGFTTGFAYILFSGIIVNAYSFTPALVGVSLIIWIIKNVFLLYGNPAVKGLLFNIGFAATLSAICYQPSIVIIIAIIFALGILRPFKPAEWLILLLGVIAPAYLLLSGLYLFNRMDLLPIFLPKIKLAITVVKQPWYWINLSVVFILLLAGLISWYPNSNRMVIQTRKNWIVMFIFFLFLIISVLLFSSNNQFPEILCLVPIAAFVSNYLLYTRRSILANFLVLLAVIVIFHHHFELFKWK